LLILESLGILIIFVQIQEWQQKTLHKTCFNQSIPTTLDIRTPDPGLWTPDP